MYNNEWGLSEKHMAFCESYVVNNNAGWAYRQTFDPNNERLTQNSAYSSGSRLLKKEKVKKYISHLKEERREKTLLSADRIIQELSEMALDPNLKPHDRLKALELLGRNQMLFADKQVVENQIEINLTGIDEPYDRKIIDHTELEAIQEPDYEDEDED